MDEKTFWEWAEDLVKSKVLGAPPLETPGMVVSVLPKGSAEQFRPWNKNEVPSKIGQENDTSVGALQEHAEKVHAD